MPLFPSVSICYWQMTSWPLDQINPYTADEFYLWFLHMNIYFNRPAQCQHVWTFLGTSLDFQNPRERVSKLCHRLPRLHLTFEVPVMLCSITFDIKAYLSRYGRSSRDDDNADVESRVRLLGVVDVEGEVCWGHGHAEAHSFGELVLAIPNLTWVEIYHLNRENISMEKVDSNTASLV